MHYPVPLDDVVAAVDWAREAAGDLGVGSTCVVGGASAGANLAAGAALRLRDEGRPVTGVVLAYPYLHPTVPQPSDELARRLSALPDVHSYPPYDTKPMVENYLGGPLESANPYAMPGLADLDGFPATLVLNAEYDGLRASGESFATALRSVGVAVRELLVPDVLHAHLNSPWLAQAQQSYADIAAFVMERTLAL